MDPHLTQWLENHGNENVFTLFTQEQCEELVAALAKQLDTEHKLGEAAREFVKQSQQTWGPPEIKEPPSQVDDKPQQHTEPSISEPSEPSGPSPDVKAQTHSRWISFGLLGILGLAMWSATLYQFALRQGKEQQAATSVASASRCSDKEPTRYATRSRPERVTPKPSLQPLAPMLNRPMLQVGALSRGDSHKPPTLWKASTLDPEGLETEDLSAPQSPVDNGTGKHSWEIPSVSSFKWTKQPNSTSRKREFFRLPPLRLASQQF